MSALICKTGVEKVFPHRWLSKSMIIAAGDTTVSVCLRTTNQAHQIANRLANQIKIQLKKISKKKLQNQSTNSFEVVQNGFEEQILIFIQIVWADEIKSKHSNCQRS